MKAFVRQYGLICVAVLVAVVLIVAATAYAGEPSRGGVRADPPSVRAALADYSWEELSRISDEISGCSGENEAFACAARYGLCKPDGTLDASQTKPVKLADGDEVPVMLVGIWHDTRTDGGKAGLTFMFARPVAQRAMNHAFEDADGGKADSAGGWAASDMRTWLGGDFLLDLPSELRVRIVGVQKKTASAIGADDEMGTGGALKGTAVDWVSETSDSVWSFSAAEVCGKVPVHRALGVDSTMATVYGAEGQQYRLFADAGVRAFEPNESLTLCGQDGTACTWWLRTKTLEFGDGFWLVGADGTPLNGLGEDVRATSASYAPDKLWGPDHARGVVAGFCL